MTGGIERYDAIVVGGGIVGASATYHLARAGATVLLVDDLLPGRATAAGAGIVIPALAPEVPPALDSLLMAASTGYRELLASLGPDATDCHRAGALVLSRPGGDGAELTATAGRLAQRRAAGFDLIGEVAELGPDEVVQAAPILAGGRSALWLPDALWIDGSALAACLVRHAQRSGLVRTLQGPAVPAPDDDSGVTVRGNRYDGRVLVAAGAWSEQWLGLDDLTRFVYPERGQTLRLRLPGPYGPTPTILTPELGYLLAPTPGTVIVGSTHEPDSGFDTRPTVGGLRALLDIAVAVLGNVDQAEVVDIEVGLRPTGADELPTIGRVPGRDLLLATGLGSFGLMTGPFVGALAADLVLDRKPAVDLAPYDPARWLRASDPTRGT